MNSMKSTVVFSVLAAFVGALSALAVRGLFDDTSAPARTDTPKQSGAPLPPPDPKAAATQSMFASAIQRSMPAVVLITAQKRIGVTISKLGASRAISVGAYAFALSQLDAQNQNNA